MVGEASGAPSGIFGTSDHLSMPVLPVSGGPGNDLYMLQVYIISGSVHTRLFI